MWRPISSAPTTPPVKATSQAVAQGGTTTRPKRADAEAGHDRGGNHLRARIEHRKAIKRNAEPDRRAQHDVADHQPLRHSPAGAADAADRLGARELHGDEIDASRRRSPRAEAGSATPVPRGWRPSSARRRRSSRRRRARAGRARSAARPSGASFRRPPGAQPGRPTPRREVALKSNAYNDLELRTSARRIVVERAA